MVVKNLTSRVQVVNVQDFSNLCREYCIYLEPHGCTELVGLFVTNKKDLAGLVEFEKKVAPVETPKAVDLTEETPESTEETPETTKETSESDTVAVEVLDSKFICDECGAEFASNRGLVSHKTRAHGNK